MIQIRQFEKNNFLKIFLFFILVSCPVFLNLGVLPIRIWDESRLAVNAFEMHISGNYLIPTFHWLPEMWSTKPPLMIWLQVLFIKLIGANETAIRLPSAIAAFLTATTMLTFSLRYFKNYLLGLFSVLVLVTAHGYVGIHGARTGDYDVLLTLFMTVYALCFFLFIETNNKKYLLLVFTGLILAVMTKGVAGLLFTPALFIYALSRKKVLEIIKLKEFYLGLMAFLVIVCGYYFLREKYNPGYVNAVWDNELGGRYSQPLEGHDESFWFYWQNFFNFQFSK